MAPATPPPSADRNLVFGMLALQMDFLRPEDLIAALHAWMLTKTRPLGAILEERRLLTPERRAKVEALVEEWVGAPAPGPDDPESTRYLASAPLRYCVLRKHREGGLGEVFVAHDEELKRKVALKQIKAKYADHPESRSRFLLEAEITGGLEHPGVVPVYGLGSYADGRPYYAMRFIRGESLREAVRRFHKGDDVPGRDPGERSLALRDLLGRFLNVCNAVAYAHSRGVLHRDLKPSNVMLGPYGETLVVDWGLAKLIEAPPPAAAGSPPLLRPASGADVTLTRLGTPIGTPAYMAPEQADGRLDEIDVRTDVYLLGGILFEILTGRPPHPGGARGDAAPRACSVKPSAPPALEAVAARALAPAPGDRYPTAAELAREVQGWLADEPVAAYRAVVAQLEKLVGRQPAVADFREQLARNRTNLGLVLDGLGRHADSEAVFRWAVADHEGLAEAYPAVTRYRADLAAARIHLSRALAALGRAGEAEQERKQAIAEYDRLMATNPHEYRTNLASVMLTLAPGADPKPPPPEEPSLRTALPVPTAGGAVGDSTTSEAPGMAPPAPAEEPKEPRETRAQFTLTQVLGRGGAGSIWLARDNDLNREVAIKEVLAHGADDEGLRRRFLREALITAQLEHPSIVPVYSLGYRQGDVPFFVMRHVRGETLREAIARHHAEPSPAGLRRLLRAFVAVCGAVQYAHSRGVVHRDPKPANVILGELGEVVLLDWGLAKILGAPDSGRPAVSLPAGFDPGDTQEGAVIGTPAYMAPEMWTGARGAGVLADVYVLGASLFHLLTGQPPWHHGHHAQDMLEMLERVSTSPPPHPRAANASVPIPLDAVCVKAMARSPEARYASAATLADDVESWLGGGAVSVYPESRFRRLIRSLLPAP
jgi:serine/threonine protein kinase